MHISMLTLPRRALMTLVRGYRLLLSPWIGNSCRFEPTCSEYSLQALELHGACAGTYLTVHRLTRCHPFCAGGHDPVPTRSPALFRHFVTEAPSACGELPHISKPEPNP
jgi:putative membrane protein insertion efficiency factor